MSPGIFLARKFDPLTDQKPINSLEEMINSSAVREESWDYYWQNSFNTQDDDPSMEVVGNLARAIVTNLIEGKQTEVKEVTTLLVGGIHHGEIIQFVADDEVFEILVKSNQGVEIIERHSNILKRTILSMKVGDNLDIKEKIFRNWIGAFDIDSNLVLQLEFGSSVTNQLFEILEITLYINDEAVEESLIFFLDWRVGQVFLPITEITKTIAPGVWNLQMSVKKHTIGMLTILILDKEKR